MPFFGDCYIHDMPFWGIVIFMICHFWGIVISMICHCITILWRNFPTGSWNFSVDFQDVPLYHHYIFWMLSQCCQICYQICYYTCFHVLPCSFDTVFFAFLDISDSGSGYSGYLAALLLAVVLLSMLAAYMCLLRAEMRSEFEESRAFDSPAEGNSSDVTNGGLTNKHGEFNFHQHNMVILPAQIWSYSSYNWFLLAVSWFISIITRVWVEDISS